ncbi:MAG: DUF4170 domain-containing protein [Proteobacteria bacterium]|nr:DUF4170 domain-containing protein [Pseudomonadota bacterium]
MPKQYWVIGGEYNCVEFQEVIPGTARVFGPYVDFEQANQVWRERSLASRSSATTRYTIVSNAMNPARRQNAA